MNHEPDYPRDAVQFFIEESLLQEFEDKMLLACFHFVESGDLHGLKTFTVYFSDQQVGYYGDMCYMEKNLHGYEVVFSGSVFAQQAENRAELLHWLQQNDQYVD